MIRAKVTSNFIRMSEWLDFSYVWIPIAVIRSYRPIIIVRGRTKLKIVCVVANITAKHPVQCAGGQNKPCGRNLPSKHYIVSLNGSRSHFDMLLSSNRSLYFFFFDSIEYYSAKCVSARNSPHSGDAFGLFCGFLVFFLHQFIVISRACDQRTNICVKNLLNKILFRFFSM